MRTEYIWKALCAVLLFYAVIAGFLSPVPRLDILNETIRNLYFHVPMWFAMLALLTISAANAIWYLLGSEMKRDEVSEATVQVSLMFGVLGLLTGMLWARFTWGQFWPPDPKLNSAAIAMLVYLAYPILRSSMTDSIQRARVSAIFNILAYPTYIALVFILPRMTSSLHPGNGGNPGFNAYDLNSDMRMVFYPAVIGFILLGWWMASQRAKASRLKCMLEDEFQFEKEVKNFNK